MSYFKHLKLTKKGEQLQAKINGNLSETLTFTKAELGGGNIESEEEIRFLTSLKEKWGNAVIAKCELQGEEKTMVSLELQFTNAELQEDKIFRELALYARGNDEEEVLYAYANAGENYDYIPLMKDSPHSFIITIYFTISSGTKIDANIDLSGYVSLETFKEKIQEIEENLNEKEPKFEKRGGFNLDIIHVYDEKNRKKVVSGEALYNLWELFKEKIASIKLKWSDIEGKPKVFPPSAHSHSNYESSFEKNTAFNKNFGIEEGTVLEGKRLAESMGVTKYGGLIKEYGKKYQDYAYYDDNTKEMFYCTENNNLTNPSASYFKPFSNKAILNRLENLSRIPDFSRFVKTEASYSYKSYTAPEDGFIFVQLSGRSSSYATLKIDSHTIGDIGSNSNSYLNTITTFIPVRKGQKIEFRSGFMGYSYEPQFITFYYLKPEV